MHAFAIFAVNEHIAELQAEAARERLLRKVRPERPSRLSAIASRLAALFRAPDAAPAATLSLFSSIK